jgi:hypothetical protein
MLPKKRQTFVQAREEALAGPSAVKACMESPLP